MTDKERQEWLARRLNGIGASDAPKIMGLSNYGSALSVYMAKLEHVNDFEMNERMEMGILMEPVIIQRFEQITGIEVIPNSIEVWSEKFPFLFATPDGYIKGENAGLECKNIGMYSSEWDESIPNQYMVQVQHSMLVTGFDKWYIAVLFSGNKFKHYEVDRDDQLINEHILPQLKYFWFEHVEKSIPPIPQAIDGPLLAETYKDVDSDEISLDSACSELIEDYLEAQKLEAGWKKRKQSLSNMIKAKIGHHKYGVVDNKKVTWNRIESTRFDAEAFKNEHPDLYCEYVRTSLTSRLTVKEY
jgi:putative phage-type endonuclease